MFAYMKVLFTCTASTASPHIHKAINVPVTTFQPNQIGGKKDFFIYEEIFFVITKQLFENIHYQYLYLHEGKGIKNPF